MKRASDVPPPVENSGALPVDLSYGLGDQIGERAWRGDEGDAAQRRFQNNLAAAMIGDLARFVLKQRYQTVRRMKVVEADVELSARFGGNHIGCRVAGIDAGEGEGGGFEMRRAFIQRQARKPCGQGRQRRHRIARLVRISDMALHAFDSQRAH